MATGNVCYAADAILASAQGSLVTLVVLVQVSLKLINITLIIAISLLISGSLNNASFIIVTNFNLN